MQSAAWGDLTADQRDRSGLLMPEVKLAVMKRPRSIPTGDELSSVRKLGGALHTPIVMTIPDTRQP